MKFLSVRFRWKLCWLLLCLIFYSCCYNTEQKKIKINTYKNEWNIIIFGFGVFSFSFVAPLEKRTFGSVKRWRIPWWNSVILTFPQVCPSSGSCNLALAVLLCRWPSLRASFKSLCTWEKYRCLLSLQQVTPAVTASHLT